MVGNMFKVNIKDTRTTLTFLSMALTIYVCMKNSIHVYVYKTKPGKIDRFFTTYAIFINVVSDVLHPSSDYNFGLKNLIWDMWITNTPKGNKTMIIS